MTALTAAAAMAIINIEPENLLRMMDLPLPCSMLLFARNSRQLWMVAVFGMGNIAQRAPTVRAQVGRPPWEPNYRTPATPPAMPPRRAPL